MIECPTRSRFRVVDAARDSNVGPNRDPAAAAHPQGHPGQPDPAAIQFEEQSAAPSAEKVSDGPVELVRSFDVAHMTGRQDDKCRARNGGL